VCRLHGSKERINGESRKYCSGTPAFLEAARLRRRYLGFVGRPFLLYGRLHCLRTRAELAPPHFLPKFPRQSALFRHALSVFSHTRLQASSSCSSTQPGPSTTLPRLFAPTVNCQPSAVFPGPLYYFPAYYSEPRRVNRCSLESTRALPRCHSSASLAFCSPRHLVRIKSSHRPCTVTSRAENRRKTKFREEYRS
jgi:hypothetical protein